MTFLDSNFNGAGSGFDLTNFVASTSGAKSTAHVIENFSNSTDCYDLRKEHMGNDEISKDFVQPFTAFPIVGIVLAAFVMLVNIIVVAALVRSWHKLRQSIYIFALNIALCDAFLGLVFLGNSVHHLSVEGQAPNTDDALYMDATAWFFKIKSAIFMATEIATAWNTALIATAFSRYVSAQIAHPNSERERRNTSGRQIRRTSVLLSRKKSYIFSGAVWLLSAALFATGLLWNCTKDCLCFLSSGILVESHAAADCYFANNCSFLFPSVKQYYGIVCVVLFLSALTVIIVMCSYTIHLAGGLGVVLPYRMHLNLIRKRNKRRLTGDGQSSSAVRRRNSVQLSYMRSMTHFIVAVTTSYIFLRLPINLLLLADCLSMAEHLVPVKLVQIFNLLSFFQSFINPLIFYLTLHRMKQATNDLFTLCCSQTVEVRRGTGQSKNDSEVTPSGNVVDAKPKRSIRFKENLSVDNEADSVNSKVADQ